MPKQPNDEYADLPISSQAKWAKRHKDKVNAYRRKWSKTPEGKESVRKASRRYWEKINSIDNANKVE